MVKARSHGLRKNTSACMVCLRMQKMHPDRVLCCELCRSERALSNLIGPAQ